VEEVGAEGPLDAVTGCHLLVASTLQFQLKKSAEAMGETSVTVDVSVQEEHDRRSTCVAAR
jgi:hypothetical protein